MSVLINARFHPVGGPVTPPNAMAWEGERILSLGEKQALVRRYPHDRRVDVHGGVVVPGFIDSHIHSLQGILYRRALD